MENILFEMRDHLSRSKVIETELAKPFFDALLRVAQGSHSAEFERSDAVAEKVGPQTVVLSGDDQQKQKMRDGTSTWADVARTHGPAFSEFQGSCRLSRIGCTEGSVS